MKYYKIVWGYDDEDMLPIDETELEKAMYCFITKKDGVFNSGPIKGDKIITIQPDYHRAMGWSRGYRLGPDDYREIGTKLQNEHTNFLEEAKYQASQKLNDSARKQLDGPTS